MRHVYMVEVNGFFLRIVKVDKHYEVLYGNCRLLNHFNSLQKAEFAAKTLCIAADPSQYRYDFADKACRMKLDGINKELT